MGIFWVFVGLSYRDETRGRAHLVSRITISVWCLGCAADYPRYKSHWYGLVPDTMIPRLNSASRTVTQPAGKIRYRDSKSWYGGVFGHGFFRLTFCVSLSLHTPRTSDHSIFLGRLYPNYVVRSTTCGTGENNRLVLPISCSFLTSVLLMRNTF